MNNHILSQINGTEANSLHNTFVIDVSRIAETVEPISYLVTLQQVMNFVFSNVSLWTQSVFVADGR